MGAANQQDVGLREVEPVSDMGRNILSISKAEAV